jgi:hypothetical protein
MCGEYSRWGINAQPRDDGIILGNIAICLIHRANYLQFAAWRRFFSKRAAYAIA